MQARDPAFKFILILGLLVIIMVAIISTVNCTQHNNEQDRQHREMFAGYVAISDASKEVMRTAQTTQQKALRDLLNDYLVGSDNWKAGLGVSAISLDDVYVLPRPADVAANLTPAGAPLSSKPATLDMIACPVSSSLYVDDEACASLYQATGENPCQVRVFDSLYSVSSTCFRVHVKDSNKLFGSPAAYALMLLRPFAIRVSEKIFKVASITATSSSSSVTPSPFDIQVGGVSFPVQSHPTKSIVITAYYLDFIDAIYDYYQNKANSKPSTPTLTSVLDPSNLTLTLSSAQKVMYDFNSNKTIADQAKTTTVAATTGTFPGLLNPAKIARQFGYSPASAGISSKQVMM